MCEIIIKLFTQIKTLFTLERRPVRRTGLIS